MSLIRISLLLALIAFLAACVRPAPPPAAPAGLAPTAPPTLSAATLVATLAPTPDEAVPVPATLPPATPSSPTPQSTPTPESPTPTPAPPTPDPLVSQIMASIAPVIYDSFPSPDGRWQARVVKYNCSVQEPDVEVALEQLRLIDSAGLETVADSQLIFCGGLGAFGLAGRFWSADSRFFYYTNAREGVPDGCGFWQPPWLRLEVDSLERVDLGAGSLARSGQRLATWQGDQLVIWDVTAGEVGRLELEVPGAVAGPIAWSPAGDALAYLQVESVCPVSGASYLVLVDANTLAQRLLNTSADPTFADLAWDAPEAIRLHDAEGKAWQVDVASGALFETP